MIKNNNIFGSLELPNSRLNYNKIINTNNQYKKVTLSNLRDSLKTYSKDNKQSGGTGAVIKKQSSKLELMSPNPFDKKFSQRQCHHFAYYP